MVTKYSKPSEFLLEYKQGMFSQDKKALEDEQRILDLYKSQPERTACKNCLVVLGQTSFVKKGVEYVVCQCGHLNGRNEDTNEFCQHLYVTEAEAYGAEQLSDSKSIFEKRVKDIYRPKADFLLENLPKGLMYADIGAGAGHFLVALKQTGADAIGYEVSQLLISNAKSLYPDIEFQSYLMDDTLALAKTVDADVVCLIGVLEHLQYPREFLGALKRNKRVKYLYISVPLFSPSVFIECAFPNTTHRHLSGGHTHLYTDRSLQHMEKEFGITRTAEWWFGQDVMDIYRSILATTDSKEFSDMFLPLLNPLQSEIDKKKLSSEVHIVYKLT